MTFVVQIPRYLHPFNRFGFDVHGNFDWDIIILKSRYPTAVNFSTCCFCCYSCKYVISCCTSSIFSFSFSIILFLSSDDSSTKPSFSFCVSSGITAMLSSSSSSSSCKLLSLLSLLLFFLH